MGMEENEALYMQALYYNEAVGPYQCLALPWWVRTSKHKTYQARHACQLEPLICGEEVFKRIRNDLRQARRSVDIVTWGFDPGMVLVRGKGAEDGVRYGDLLKQIATREEDPVTVRLLLWHDDAASYYIQKNNPGLYGTRIPTIGGYAGYYGETHDHYNRAWFDEIIANKVPNIVLHTREVLLAFRDPALAQEKYTISPVKGRLGSIYPTHHQKMILIDYDTPASAVGYVMGHNSTTDFWDTAAHRYQDGRRETLYKKNPSDANSGLNNAIDDAWDLHDRQMQMMMGRPEQPSRRKAERLLEFIKKNGFTAKPYQDVSLRVRGPILYDMNHNFCHGWAESEMSTLSLKNAIWASPSGNAGAEQEPVVRYGWPESEMKTPPLNSAIWAPSSGRMGADEPVAHKTITESLEKVPALVQSRRHLKAADFALKDCDHSAQLLRTYPAYQEKSIKECYANLTRLTHHYIFIQNQYIQYQDWASYMTSCVEKLRKGDYAKPIYVFILTSTPETDGMDLATYNVVLQFAQSESMVVEHAETVEKAKRGKTKMPITAAELQKRGIKALMGSMWSGAAQPKSRADYEETYIHAKVAIVDDVAFTVGSANLNVRSMALDSELNLLSQAKDVAVDLRRKLFKQCTEDEGPVQFGDMEETFKKWLKLMAYNTTMMANGRPLSGQIATFHVDRIPGPPVI